MDISKIKVGDIVVRCGIESEPLRVVRVNPDKGTADCDFQGIGITELVSRLELAAVPENAPALSDSWKQEDNDIVQDILTVLQSHREVLRIKAIGVFGKEEIDKCLKSCERMESWLWHVGARVKRPEEKVEWTKEQRDMFNTIRSGLHQLSCGTEAGGSYRIHLHHAFAFSEDLERGRVLFPKPVFRGEVKAERVNSDLVVIPSRSFFAPSDKDNSIKPGEEFMVDVYKK